METILVIEDTYAIREEICDILKMEGYIVYEAGTGKTGLDMAIKIKPSMIISDILMPEIDGFQLLSELKKNAKTRQIPIVFLSAKANQDAVKMGMRMGACKYLIKPVSPDDLIKTVNYHIKKIKQKNHNMKHHEKEEDFNH